MLDLDRIEALANAATPGEWTIEREEIDNEDGVLDGDPIGFPSRVGPIVLWDHAAGNDNVDRVEADVAFIVAMRDEAAGLVAELRAARAEVERLRTAAADERAGEGGPHDAGDCTSCDLAASIRDGAHVGAAKGVER